MGLEESKGMNVSTEVYLTMKKNNVTNISFLFSARISYFFLSSLSTRTSVPSSGAAGFPNVDYVRASVTSLPVTHRSGIV